jgi:ABC-2 type transport system permease protein
VIGTFAYLILTSARNRLRQRIKRLRNPRYAFALVLGIAYVYTVYLRPSSHQPRVDEVLGDNVIALLPLVTLAFVAWTWLSGGDQSALAFTEAEVTLLFTAPVSRRTLVLYKIARTQLKIILTSVVWTLVLRQSATWTSTLAHMASYWVMLSTLNLNRLGAALVRANASAHGLRGAGRNWIAISVFVAILGMVVVPVIVAWPGMHPGDGFSTFATELAAVLGRAPARWALYPFHILTAPLGRSPGAAWFAAFGESLLLLTVIAVWVLHTDAAFEETAAEATTQQAKRVENMRQRRSSTAATVRHPARTLPLAPTGPPAVALFWKNAMWIVRTGQLRGLLAPPLIGAVGVALFAVRSQSAATLIAIGCVLLSVATLVMGPLSMRNDLRSELLHLSLLKTFPLRGRDIVLAEVASGALPQSMTQYLLLIVALLAIALSGAAMPSAGVIVAGALVAPGVLVGINGAVFMIHNALALLFPGWVRLGTGGGGIETVGLGMITLTMALVMLAVLIVIPGLAAATIFALFRARPALAVALGGSLAGLLLVGENVLCAWALGGSLERVEPLAVEA